MASDDLVVRLDRIHFAFPGQEPLYAGLDFQVRRDERVGIVGANGSGKTTLLHLIIGLLRPSSGELAILGREVARESDFEFVRERVGFLFQDSEDQLFCPTVEEDVAFGPLNLGRCKDEARAIAGETLGQLGLEGYGDRITYQLSGGEKRLVALATVLAMRPEVLLLDEPANGLDPGTRREFLALLARVGGTQIITSHDMELIRATCHRTVVIHQGRLLADGPTDEILGDPELMLAHGLEVPLSLVAEREASFDHQHGAGPGHGHGHDLHHDLSEHRPEEEGPS